MEWWGGGVMECWSAGVLECWSAGVLESEYSSGARLRQLQKLIAYNELEEGSGVLECWKAILHHSTTPSLRRSISMRRAWLKVGESIP